jgi:hypothetical protein
MGLTCHWNSPSWTLPLFLLSSPLQSASSHCPGIYVNEEKVRHGTVARHVLLTHIYEILFLLASRMSGWPSMAWLDRSSMGS